MRVRGDGGEDVQSSGGDGRRSQSWVTLFVSEKADGTDLWWDVWLGGMTLFVVC